MPTVLLFLFCVVCLLSGSASIFSWSGEGGALAFPLPASGHRLPFPFRMVAAAAEETPTPPTPSTTPMNPREPPPYQGEPERNTIFIDPRTGVRRLSGTTVQSTLPVYAYLSSLPPVGFPYHYYFEQGVTHLVFPGVSFDAKSIALLGLNTPSQLVSPSPRSNDTSDGVEDEHKQEKEDAAKGGYHAGDGVLPHPAEWARIHDVARRYNAKLILGIGGVNWTMENELAGLSRRATTHWRRPTRSTPSISDPSRSSNTSSASSASLEAKEAYPNGNPSGKKGAVPQSTSARKSTFRSADRVERRWMVEGYSDPDDPNQKGLDRVLELYFYFVEADIPPRHHRVDAIHALGKFLVDWDFDGVDVDYRHRKGIDTGTIWVAVKNLVRDIREEVEAERAKRVEWASKEAFVYPHFLTSITMPVAAKAMVVTGMADHFDDVIDVVHWRVFHGLPEDNFFYRQDVNAADGGTPFSYVTPATASSSSASSANFQYAISVEEEEAAEANGLETEKNDKTPSPPRRSAHADPSQPPVDERVITHAVGHGPQDGSFFYHCGMNFTLYHALHIAESRYAREYKKQDMLDWYKRARARWDDDAILEEVPRLFFRPNVYAQRKAEMEEAQLSLCTPPRTPTATTKSGDGEEGGGDAPPLPSSSALHSLMIPFFGVDLQRGRRAYADILQAIEDDFASSPSSLSPPTHAEEKNPAVVEAVKEVYILDGMGFDHQKVVQQKLRVAAQLGFEAVAIWGVDLDVLPASPLPTEPALPVPPSVVGLGVLDLSGGKTFSSSPSSTAPHPLSPLPPVSPFSLLGSIKEEVARWTTEMRERTATHTTEEEGKEAPPGGDLAAAAASSPTMCSPLSIASLEPYLFRPSTIIPRLHRSLPRPSVREKRNIDYEMGPAEPVTPPKPPPPPPPPSEGAEKPEEKVEKVEHELFSDVAPREGWDDL